VPSGGSAPHWLPTDLLTSVRTALAPDVRLRCSADLRQRTCGRPAPDHVRRPTCPYGRSKRSRRGGQWSGTAGTARSRMPSFWAAGTRQVLLSRVQAMSEPRSTSCATAMPATKIAARNGHRLRMSDLHSRARDCDGPGHRRQCPAQSAHCSGWACDEHPRRPSASRTVPATGRSCGPAFAAARAHLSGASGHGGHGLGLQPGTQAHGALTAALRRGLRIAASLRHPGPVVSVVGLRPSGH